MKRSLLCFSAAIAVMVGIAQPAMAADVTVTPIESANASVAEASVTDKNDHHTFYVEKPVATASNSSTTTYRSLDGHYTLEKTATYDSSGETTTTYVIHNNKTNTTTTAPIVKTSEPLNGKTTVTILDTNSEGPRGGSGIQITVTKNGSGTAQLSTSLVIDGMYYTGKSPVHSGTVTTNANGSYNYS